MKKTVSFIAILVLFMALPAWADMTLNIKLNFFGPSTAGKGKSKSPPRFTSSQWCSATCRSLFPPQTCKPNCKKLSTCPRFLCWLKAIWCGNRAANPRSCRSCRSTAGICPGPDAFAQARGGEFQGRRGGRKQPE